MYCIKYFYARHRHYYESDIISPELPVNIKTKVQSLFRELVLVLFKPPDDFL